MGGFVQADESPELAASRVLKKLTGLENVYMEQCSVFGDPKAPPSGSRPSAEAYSKPSRTVVKLPLLLYKQLFGRKLLFIEEFVSENSCAQQPI